MSDSLEAVRLKIRRAHEHLYALQLAVQGFLWREPYNALGQFDREQDAYVVRWVVREHPPASWGPLFGDFVHNLRSALDLLAITLVEVTTPAAPTCGTAFPIFDRDPCRSKADPRERRAWESRVKGMSPDQIAMIRAVQPFDTPIPVGLVNTLSVLRELSNLDKHRGLAPFIGVAGGVIQHEIRQAKDCVLGTLELASQDLTPEHGAEIARFPVTVTGPNPEVEVRVQVPLSVSIAVPPIPPGTPVSELFASISTRVLDIVNDFDRRFFS